MQNFYIDKILGVPVLWVKTIGSTYLLFVFFFSRHDIVHTVDTYSTVPMCALPIPVRGGRWVRRQAFFFFTITTTRTVAVPRCCC